MSDDNIRNAYRIVGALMHQIANVFVPGIKLTLCARLPGDPEADCIVTDDPDLGEVQAMIERRKGQPPEIKGQTLQ
jgi:hypothetical protein